MHIYFFFCGSDLKPNLNTEVATKQVVSIFLAVPSQLGLLLNANIYGA